MRNQLKHEKKEINKQTNKKEQPRITSTPQSNNNNNKKRNFMYLCKNKSAQDRHFPTCD